MNNIFKDYDTEKTSLHVFNRVGFGIFDDIDAKVDYNLSSTQKV